ncbi:hypothetical protein FRC05_002601 [Tulasnella sp. 425]|nr:hypothetical protein FRC05_002601 [Tulasnella sp. 425]
MTAEISFAGLAASSVSTTCYPYTGSRRRSKDTIIVEIDDFNNHKGRILGEHLWINVFKNVHVEDKQKSSKLFLCPLGNYLKLEQQRWREIKIKADWFKSWDPNRNTMVHMPYPKSNWCDLPDIHGIDEFCGKIPVSLFPEEEARRAKPKESETSEKKLSAQTTPGALTWNKRIPNTRVRPTLDPASVPQLKQPVIRNYRKVEVATTEQSMRAVLGPPAPKPIALDKNGLLNLKPEYFDWFQDVEDQDDAAGWRLQEPPNWELSQVSMAEQPSTSVNACDNAWYEGPSWDDDEPETPSTGGFVM